MDIRSVDTLILCGGKGTRLHSIIPDKPKILAEVQDHPFIDILLNQLESQGIKKIILCTGYKHKMIKDWVTSSYNGGLKILFSQENKPMGTAGAIRNARDLILSKYFFILNGDTYTNISYNSFLDDFKKKDPFGSIVIKKINNSIDYGVIITDKYNRLLSFNEKIVSNNNSFINLGIYIFKKEIINEIKINSKVSLEYDIIPFILKQENKPIYTYKHQGSFVDFGTPNGYVDINQLDIDKRI